MRKLLVIACFSLVAFVVMTPKAQAGGRFVVSFGFGFGGYYPYYGGYHGGYYGYPYGYPAYGYAYGIPYAAPFMSYGYVPSPRLYPAPSYYGYTLYLPRYRVQPAPGRVNQPNRGSPRNYGAYAPRQYNRR